MARLYRIYTELLEPVTLGKQLQTTSQCFNSFTVLHGTGYWQGQQEKSLIIEIVADGSIATQCEITSLAEEIKAIGKQEFILVTSQAVDVKFI